MVGVDATSIVGSNIKICSSGLSQCDVTVQTGGNYFLYVAATGCAVSATTANYVQDLQVSSSGIPCLTIGHLSSNTGIANTNGALFQEIAGIDVSGALVKIITFENSQSNTLTENFNLPQDSLVVLISASSGRVLSPISVSAPFTIDKMDSQGASLGMVLAHVMMAPGSQKFTVTYSTNITPTPDNVIGVVLYVFSLSSEQQYHPAIIPKQLAPPPTAPMNGPTMSACPPSGCITTKPSWTWEPSDGCVLPTYTGTSWPTWKIIFYDILQTFTIVGCALPSSN